MARPLPPAGVIPARHPDLARLWLTREAGNVAFRHMRRLISALYCVAPGVLEDPDFLERSVVVDGVAPSISPRELQESFSVLAVEAAVVVRDSETGYRVGLVVFADAAERTSATNLSPRPGFYVTCIPASRNGDTRRCILDALDDEAKRRPTAELLRSLVPPQYLLDDEDAEFHLRCVFVYGAGVAGGAYGLCRAARDHLLARGYVCATVVWRGGDAGVVVYDDAETTELVAT
ncbi:hypothetical protein E2562_002411 [Oryza meyeriana var. granulata]|uniref:Uncharacterized protein n=1 Tax=Oryza meyeriana var. granulata TaxID=110450 RepID=A0A6G1F2H5_9ORYZ|nr:hypothetical protein E2562_002411 [Oryza meyeriana var. granulata]